VAPPIFAPLLRNGMCRVYGVFVHMARIPDTCQDWAEGGHLRWPL
jgi:hypothetical protein